MRTFDQGLPGLFTTVFRSPLDQPVGSIITPTPQGKRELPLDHNIVEIAFTDP
jgi:hypothetical protein